MGILEFKIRPLPNPGQEKTAWRKASRIVVSKESLIELTSELKEGKLCVIEKTSGDGGQTSRREATLYYSKTQGPLGKSVVQMGEQFRLVGDYNHTDQVRISVSPSSSAVPDAEEVVVEDITATPTAAPQAGEGSGSLLPISAAKLAFWEWTLAGELARGDSVFPGMQVPDVYANGQERRFAVVSVNGQSSNVARFVPDTTNVTISQRKAVNGGRSANLAVASLSGLESQVKELNDFLAGFNRKFFYSGERRSCGLVIYGGHGTGKSLLVNRICETGWGAVHRVVPGDKLSAIQATFRRAREQQPSIVAIDGLERLIDKERSNRAQVIEAIGDFLDKLAQEAVQNGELPKVAVVATCLDYTTEMPPDLRRSARRFHRNIFLPLPDAQCRRAILASFNIPLHPDRKEGVLTDLSERTHAYNGDDLERLAEEVGYLGGIHLQESGCSPDGVVSYVPEQIIELALQKVRPTAMHDINLKPPPIHWEDIGGQEAVKEALRLAVRMSTESKEVLSSFIDHPPKGLLLYGPPGCSKTMAAQAMATESGLNFFAVKGAELLNMYVGESERAVRRLFERARAAAPAMIFFDEIDAIAGQRHGFGSNGTASHSSGGGLNVLTTLLNEMDGFETTQGVLVLAATNRPQALDPALLRPGRLDKLVYVSPPDQAARLAIFRRALDRRRRETERVGGLDVQELAVLTEGYSGAEIVNICRAAGEAAYKRYSERRERGGGQKEGAGMSEDEGASIRREDLMAAIERQMKLITPEMVKAYREWERQFRKS